MRLRGRWTNENRAALETLLRREYPYPPIAIFDWDQTSMHGDVADAVFHQLCRELAFQFESPEFTRWVQEIPVPTRILEWYELWRARPGQETRSALRFELERTRHALHESEDDNQAWAWDSGAFVGWKPSAVREYARRVIARELAAPIQTEYLSGDFAHGDAGSASQGQGALALRRGLRARPEMHELAAEFRRAGWGVYVVSASPQWVVAAAAERYSIPLQNVIGMRRALEDGRITAAFEPPCSWGDGKLDAYQMFVTRERPPNFVAGDSVGDWKLLEWAADCELLVEPTQDALREYALARRELGESWLIQRFDTTR